MPKITSISARHESTIVRGESSYGVNVRVARALSSRKSGQKRAQVDGNLKVEVGRYMSHLLRHDSEGLEIDKCGFVDVTEFLKRIQDRFQVDQAFVTELVEKSSGRRFEIVGNKIRALYGHTIPVEHHLQEDKTVQLLYHGTTPEAASKILEYGLKPMRRNWVHLSRTKAIAVEVGLRRTRRPIVLEIDAEAARANGLSFIRATDRVYLSGPIPPRHIRIVSRQDSPRNPKSGLS